MLAKIVQFLAILLTAVALVPVGAHLLELPGKIGLGQDQYFVVQGVYRGRAMLGAVLIGALLADLALVYVMRAQRAAAALALAAAILMAVTLATFFTWIYPANQATANWTVVPANWQTLRSQWEHTHALNAVVTFAALCAVSLSLIVRR